MFKLLLSTNKARDCAIYTSKNNAAILQLSTG